MSKTKILNPARLLALFLILGMQLFAMASADSIKEDKVIVNVTASQSEKALSLYIANIYGQQTSISIANEYGDTYFESFVEETDAYARNFNLSVLPRGNYELVVEREMTSIKQKFKVGFNGKITIGEKSIEDKPVIFQKKGIVQVYFQDGLTDRVNVAFINDKEETIFEDEFFVTTRSLKQFNLQELTPGQYRVQISTPSKTISKMAYVD